MTILGKISVRFLLFVAPFFWNGWGGNGRPHYVGKNKIPGQVECKARRLMHNLKKEGFDVSRGFFKLWTAEDCEYSFNIMGT